MKRIINILFWGLISVASFLGSLWYLYIGINQSKLIYVMMCLIGLLVGGYFMKETVSWIKKNV